MTSPEERAVASATCPPTVRSVQNDRLAISAQTSRTNADVPAPYRSARLQPGRVRRVTG
jgi:hypothetical protein